MLQGAVEWLVKGALAAAVISPGLINILDLGSATGNNSAKELKPAVDAILQVSKLIDDHRKWPVWQLHTGVYVQ